MKSYIDTSCRVREPVQDNECIEKQYYSTVRKQLFPMHDILEMENHKKDEELRVTLNDESNKTLNEENDHVALMNEDLIFTQTVNQNECQIVTIDPQVPLTNENLSPAQTIMHNENDTNISDTLNIPEWYIEIITSNNHPN